MQTEGTGDQITDLSTSKITFKFVFSQGNEVAKSQAALGRCTHAVSLAAEQDQLAPRPLYRVFE